jgi:hypothetical protein
MQRGYKARKRPCRTNASKGARSTYLFDLGRQESHRPVHPGRSRAPQTFTSTSWAGGPSFDRQRQGDSWARDLTPRPSANGLAPRVKPRLLGKRVMTHDETSEHNDYCPEPLAQEHQLRAVLPPIGDMAPSVATDTAKLIPCSVQC